MDAWGTERSGRLSALTAELTAAGWNGSPGGTPAVHGGDRVRPPLGGLPAGGAAGGHRGPLGGVHRGAEKGHSPGGPDAGGARLRGRSSWRTPPAPMTGRRSPTGARPPTGSGPPSSGAWCWSGPAETGRHGSPPPGGGCMSTWHRSPPPCMWSGRETGRR